MFSMENALSFAWLQQCFSEATKTVAAKRGCIALQCVQVSTWLIGLVKMFSLRHFRIEIDTPLLVLVVSTRPGWSCHFTHWFLPGILACIANFHRENHGTFYFINIP
jgi:hypothetical protein